MQLSNFRCGKDTESVATKMLIMLNDGGNCWEQETLYCKYREVFQV